VLLPGGQVNVFQPRIGHVYCFRLCCLFRLTDLFLLEEDDDDDDGFLIPFLLDWTKIFLAATLILLRGTN